MRGLSEEPCAGSRSAGGGAAGVRSVPAVVAVAGERGLPWVGGAPDSVTSPAGGMALGSGRGDVVGAPDGRKRMASKHLISNHPAVFLALVVFLSLMPLFVLLVGSR